MLPTAAAAAAGVGGGGGQDSLNLMIAVASGSLVRLMGFSEDGTRTDVGVFNLQVLRLDFKVRRIPIIDLLSFSVRPSLSTS